MLVEARSYFVACHVERLSPLCYTTKPTWNITVAYMELDVSGLIVGDLQLAYSQGIGDMSL